MIFELVLCKSVQWNNGACLEPWLTGSRAVLPPHCPGHVLPQPRASLSPGAPGPPCCGPCREVATRLGEPEWRIHLAAWQGEAQASPTPGEQLQFPCVFSVTETYIFFFFFFALLNYFEPGFYSFKPKDSYWLFRDPVLCPPRPMKTRF